MGRNVDKAEIPNRPTSVIADIPANSSYISTAGTASATNSLTALALQGPGFVSFAVIQNLGANPQKIINRIWVDGTQCLSASDNIVVNQFKYLVSGGAVGEEDYALVFKDSFLWTYEMPTGSSSFTVNIRVKYRLTQ